MHATLAATAGLHPHDCSMPGMQQYRKPECRETINTARGRAIFLFYTVACQVKIHTDKSDSDMYRTWYEPILAYMGMQKAIIYNTGVI